MVRYGNEVVPGAIWDVAKPLGGKPRKLPASPGLRQEYPQRIVELIRIQYQ